MKAPKPSEHHFPKTVLNLLRFHGLLPRNDSRLTIVNRIKICLKYFCLEWILFGTIPFLIKYMGNSKVDITDNILVLFISIFFVYTFCLFLMKINDVVRVVTELGNFEEFGKPRNLEQFKERHDMTMKLWYGYCVVGVPAYVAMVYFEGLDCERNNIKENKENVCGLLVPVWFPFGLVELLGKKVVLMLEAVGMIVAVLTAIVGACFNLTCIDMITIRVKHLNEVLEGVTNRTKIKWCLKYHVHILKLTRTYNDVFNSLNAVHLTLSSVILGILNYQLLQKLQPEALIHQVGWIVTLTLVCNSGQNLIDAGSEITETLYALDWYDFDSESKFYVAMALMASQEELSISAGIFYSYSFELLLAIVRASFSYMTLMNRMENFHSIKM